MGKRTNRVCPVELSGSLDNPIRRWFQNPRKILGPYIREGMRVLDLGCGPGFFSLFAAEMVGETGSVVAADLQEGMLQKVRDKIKGTELEKIITLHRCREESIGLHEPVDFILLFYVVHEIPDKRKLFQEIRNLLKPGGLVYIVEPPLHVSMPAFEESVKIAVNAGLKEVLRPKMLISKGVILIKQE